MDIHLSLIPKCVIPILKKTAPKLHHGYVFSPRSLYTFWCETGWGYHASDWPMQRTHWVTIADGLIHREAKDLWINAHVCAWHFTHGRSLRFIIARIKLLFLAYFEQTDNLSSTENISTDAHIFNNKHKTLWRTDNTFAANLTSCRTWVG